MSANLNKCKAWLIASNLIDQIIRYKENLKMKAILIFLIYLSHELAINQTELHLYAKKRKRKMSHISFPITK